MSQSVSGVVISLFVFSVACSQAQSVVDDANEGIDSLNARLAEAYRSRDPLKYGAVFTDTAVFEWPAFNTVRGRAGLEAMARSNWPALNSMELQLTVTARRLASDHATEFGAFQQSWRDTSGRRMVEFGRYVAVLARQEDGTWLMDRFFGFEDSVRRVELPRRRKGS